MRRKTGRQTEPRSRPTDRADKKGYECEIVMQELAMFYVLATLRVFRYILYLFFYSAIFSPCLCVFRWVLWLAVT